MDKTRKFNCSENLTDLKKRRKSKYSLSQRIISAVTAAGFIMQPVAAFAHSITATEGFGTTLEKVNDKVTNIWAGKVVDKTAINMFDKFGLNANEIANMYFGTQGNGIKGATAENLVNFVNSRIDINGTVNAIQNEKIGGNLFFLSKDGMAVGKSGVINTGALYVMTPAQDNFEDIQTIVKTGTDSIIKDNLNKYTDTTQWSAIPLNPSGTITVLGKVNATNEVKMRAAKIAVGKNNTDEVIDEVNAGEVVSDAIVRTGVTNFDDLVNTNGDANLGRRLRAEQTGSGDIVLTAYNDEGSEDIVTGSVGILGKAEESAEDTFKNQDFTASVDIYGTVDAAGKADISAVAVNSNVDEETTSVKSEGAASQLATVDASINIGGSVTANDDVQINAEAINKYIDNTGTFTSGLKLAVGSGTPITGDIAYSVLETNAVVNVEKGAVVTSTAGNVDIDAKAETLAASAASATGLKYKTLGGNSGSFVPAASVVYTEADNDANVTIAGSVTAAKDLTVDADAKLAVDSENVMSIRGKDENVNQVVVGVAVTNAENNAAVNITDDGDDKAISAGNDLKVNANAENTFNSTVSIKTGDSSALSTAVNISNFASGANVTVDTGLEAGSDLAVNANNTVKENTVVAESTLGSSKYVSSAMQVSTANGLTDTVKNAATDAANAVAGFFNKSFPTGDDDTLGKFRISEMFKAGVSVAYNEESNTSGVTIGKNGSLNAKEGTLTVGANTVVKDAHMLAQGITNSFNDDSYTEAVISGSVLVNNMENTSSITVEERDDAAKTVLYGKNGVNINSNSRFEYNRIDNMISQVEDAVAQIKEGFENLGKAISGDANGTISNFEDKLDAWDAAFETFKAKSSGADETFLTSENGIAMAGDAFTAASDLMSALNDLNDALAVYEGEDSQTVKEAAKIFGGVSDMFTGAMAFADPNSYGNFAAVSTAKSSSGDTGSVAGHTATAINGAGSVVVNMIDSQSSVNIGENVGIDSERDVKIGAENYMKDVTLGGLSTGIFTNSSGAKGSLGATVNYAEFNTDTIVVVGDGVQITGGNIAVSGDNTIDHVSVAASAGKGADEKGAQGEGIILNGMLSFVNGSSNILTVVDDGAKLIAEQNSYTETDDEEGTVEKTTEGKVSIKGHNNTSIVNVAAGGNLGHGTAAIGASLAYNNFDVANITGVADVAAHVKALYGDDADKKAAGHEENSKQGEISAYGFEVDAATDGSIQSASVAGSASTNDSTGEKGFFDKISSGINDLERKVVGDGGLVDKVGSKFSKEEGGMNDFFNIGSKSHGSGGNINIGDSGKKGNAMPSFSIAGAGSVSLNMVDSEVSAIVDNANITMQKGVDGKGDMNVTARDASYIGAYSGSAAIQWKSSKEGGTSGKSAAIAGAAGVNDVTNSVKATISNSSITGAGELNAMALSGSEQLALGLGLEASKNSDKNMSVGAAGSVNLIEHEVSSLLKDNTVTDTENVNVDAYARDIENTGGGNLAVGQQTVGIGASVSVSQLTNNITAGIEGGSYTNVGSVDVEAINALKNITVGLAAGATFPNGDGTTANIEGAGVYNEINNTTNAYIKGSEKGKTVISASGDVTVNAQDAALDDDNILEQRLTDGLTDNIQEITERMGDYVDLSGTSYLNGIDTSGAGNENLDIKKGTGSSIITVAGSLAVTSGSGAVGAGVAVTDINNNYTAAIEYADVNAEKVDAQAGSDSNIVTVAGGVGVSKKLSGVGSVSWNDVKNTAKVNISNSDFKAQTVEAEAANTAQIVSVVGQISGSKGSAVGAGLGYVGLDNTTNVNVKNSTFDKQSVEEAEGTSITANAVNKSDSYNIGASVEAALGEAAISGTVVVTQTSGTSGAVIDGASINNAKEVKVNALDDTDIVSVIGSVDIGSKGAVGAGVAYTEIGGVSTDKEKAEQHVAAAIKNSAITVDDGGKITVKAIDSAKVTNVAVGVGGSTGYVAVEGASATTLINKDTSATIENSNINSVEQDAEDDEKTAIKKADVTVSASNDSEITSSASVAAVSGKVSVGAGVAVNRIIQQTNAQVTGNKDDGAIDVGNLTVQANGKPCIENIGVGGAGAGNAAVTGSVAVNMIQNDVKAHIGDGANIIAEGNIGVIAASDEQIANYAGSAAVGVQGAGVGVSVAVNQINGTTEATVGGAGEAETKVTALGNGDGLTTDTVIDVDKEINNTLIDSETVDLESKIDRTEETRNGLIVDSSSSRDMKSFIVNAGVAGQGAGVGGTVNVNTIAGATNAGVINSLVNNGEEVGNVIVNAGDYTNASGFVGSAGLAVEGAGVGLGSDTNVVNRAVTAQIADSAINAAKFELDAYSAQGVSSFTVGAGIAGIGAGVAGVVSVTELQNSTIAAVANSTVQAEDIDISAQHKGIVNAGNVGVGGGVAGVGVAVGVLKDESQTGVVVEGEEGKETVLISNGNIDIAAENTSTVKPVISSAGIGGGGVAGATSVNNINSEVIMDITNAQVTSKSGSITAGAKNTFNVDAYMGANAAGALIGVGASVTVNTIDSTVQANVKNSKLTAAKNVEVTAEEVRNITQLATNAAFGGAAVGANVAVTTVGKEVTNEDALNAINQANDAYKGEDGKDDGDTLLSGAAYALRTAGIKDKDIDLAVDAGKGGKESQITVNFTDSKVTAGETFKAEAKETDDIGITLGSGSVGAVAVSAGVGILDVNRNVAVNISGGFITADTIDVDSNVAGTATLNVYQGSAGLVSGNAAVGQVNTAGFSNVVMNGVTMTGNNIDILAKDGGSTEVNALGITVGVAAAGAIVTEAENDSSVTVEIKDSMLQESKEKAADDEEKEAVINVTAEKVNVVEAHSTGGIGGVLSGSGVVATAVDNGTSNVIVGSKEGKDANTFSAESLKVKAVSSPAVKAIADSVSVGIAGTAGASVATAEANGGVNVNIYDNNKLFVDTADVIAEASTAKGKNTAEAYVEGNSGGGFASIAANVAKAETDIDVNAYIGALEYKTATEETIMGYEFDEDGNKKPIVEDVTYGVTKLNVNVDNSTKTAADARGVTIGGLFSSGNNVAQTSNISQTTVNMAAGDSSRLGQLTINAGSEAENTATADGSGGALVSGDLAAYVDNDMDVSTSVNISGTMNVEGDILINALQTDTANINADALKATVIGASATKADNDIKGGTQVNIEDAVITGNGAMDVNATNTVNFGNKEEYAVEGSGYGGVSIQGAEFNNNITKTASINIKDNSQIVTVGSQTMEAKNIGNIQAGGYIKAAGAGAFTWVNVNNAVTSNNSVNVENGSELETAKAGADITLAAVDNMDIRANGVADTQGGAIGGASSDVDNTLTRNNAITVSGTIYSRNDVNLYAGKDKDGNEGKLDLEAESEAYNKTALAVADPKLADTINQNNTVVINSGSDVSSVRHINAYADAGKETIRDTAVMYTWYYSDKDENYTSSTIGNQEPENKNSNNFVQADGKLTAGVDNKQYITIGGTYNPETGETEGSQIVFLNKDTLQAVKDYGNGQENAVGADGIKIEVSGSSADESVTKNVGTVGTFDYGKSLFERYNELSALMSAYGENKNSTAYLGYKAERDRLQNEMKELGLLQTLTAKDGTEYDAPVEGMTIDYIELNDIVASGGNINIQSDNFTGQGELTANGSPEIVINNNTNLYLKVNDIKVGEEGGEINYNNVNITADNANATIASMNKDSSKNVGFTNVVVDAGDKSGGRLVINGNYGGGAIYAEVKDADGKTQKIQTIPRSDIEINGNIISENGIVEITSAANNIVIQGKDASSSASVVGKEIHLEAAQGSISQGFQEGIVSIGGNVQDQYEDLFEQAKNEFDEKYGFKHDTVSDKKSYDNTGTKAEGNMISGENIYLEAYDININGYMQSGYADYVLEIDAEVQKQIDQIQQNWQENGSKTLADSMITTGDTYKIVAGKNVKQDDGSYIRQVDAYYNPSTGKIVVTDVDAQGGKIYLNGRISSTGGGTINVLDGAYDITVNNNTATDLQLGKLVSNDVEGIISITDTAKGVVTEMTRNATVVKNVNEWDNEAGDWKIESESGASSIYNPQDGLRYNWSNGQEVSTTEEYSNTIKAGLWGAVETMDRTDLEKFEEEHKPTTAPEETNKNKPNGEYIGQNSNAGENEFTVIYENNKYEENRTDPKVERWSTGFLGWFKWEKYTWTVTTGTSQQYVASVKADNPIKIGFIGNADGNSAINVTSKGNIDLSNNIKSSSSASTINITSQGGAINQLGGSITGDNISLNAQIGMNDINITSIGDNVNLSAVNNGVGYVDITVNGAYGKAGNVIIDKITTNSGGVALTSDGDIMQKGTDVSVIADRIDLVSNNGAVGSAEQALVVHGGQTVTDATDSLSASVNVQANENINIAQDDGDMRIGRIYSDKGDVTITVNNGDLIDALPSGETIDRGNMEELIQKWKDLGLVEGEGTYTEKQEQDVADYKESVADEYAQYTELKTYYEKNQGEVGDNYKNAYNAYKEAKGQYESLKQEFKDYQSKAVYYEDSSNTPKPENYRTEAAYQEALTVYNEGKAAFDKLQEKCSGFENADAYIKGSMSSDAYKAYTEPTIIGDDNESKNMKAVFDNYNTYSSLKDTYGTYESAEAYLAGDAAQQHIEELRAAGAGWDQDQLLYAISDTIINPDSGASDDIVKDPNIKGKNITINVTQGSVGLSSDEVTEIDITHLGSNVDDLKILANADASSVAWDTNAGKAYINEKNPIGIQTVGEGKLTVNAKENIFIAGRTENNEGIENIINIGQVKTDGDIRLQGQNGIYNTGTSDIALSGNSLFIQAGNGSIGTAEQMMTTAVTGSVQATAAEGIYLSQQSDDALQIYSMGAGKDIALKAKGDITSTEIPADKEDDEEEKQESTAGLATGYIRSDDGTITIEAGGNAGTVEHKLRILNADNDDSNKIVTVTAGKNIYLDGISNIIEKDAPASGTLFLGKVTAGGSVNIADNGAVAVNDTMTGGGNDSDITVTAEKDIAVNADITNEQGDVVLSAIGSVKLNEGTLTANKANIEASAVRDLSDEAGAGQITQGDAHRIVANTVVAAAMDGIDFSSKQNTLKKIDVWNMGVGDINIANDGTYDFNVVLAKKNDGDVTIHNYNETGDKESDMLIESQVEASGEVQFINEAGSIETAKADTFVSEHNEFAVTNEFAVKASNVVLRGSNGISNNKNIIAQRSNAEFIADEGDIANSGDITAVGDVIFKTSNGNITMNGNITSTTGNLDAYTDIGNITSEIDKNINVAGNAAIKTDKGNVGIGSSITAQNNVEVNAQDGDIALGGDVKAVTGNVNIAGNSSNITVDGEISSGKEVKVNSNNGNITVNGSTTANDGNVVTNVTGDGSITLNGMVSASNDVQAFVDGNGNIDFTGAVTAGKNVTGKITGKGNIKTGVEASITGDDIQFATNEGSIITGSDLTADKNVDLDTVTGDIILGGDVTANDGNIYIDITQSGNLKDAENTNNKLSARSGDGDTAKGNIYINIKGYGDVDLNEIYADNDARLDINSGNLLLDNINGELVAIQLRDPDKKMEVDEVIAGTQIILSGSDLSLEDVAQRPDADGMLVITPDGARDDMPIDNFHIGNIQTNAGSGIRFDHLWVNNADIHIENGQMWFDKLYVEKAAYFSNSEMTTSVYGDPPLRDGSDSIFWHDNTVNKPTDDLTAWKEGAPDAYRDKWMYLRFTEDGNVQQSNGILVHLNDYYYVYDQRFSGDNHLRYLHEQYQNEVYEMNYLPGLVYYQRYALYDLPEFGENAAADEIEVEAEQV